MCSFRQCLKQANDHLLDAKCCQSPPCWAWIPTYNTERWPWHWLRPGGGGHWLVSIFGLAPQKPSISWDPCETHTLNNCIVSHWIKESWWGQKQLQFKNRVAHLRFLRRMDQTCGGWLLLPGVTTGDCLGGGALHWTHPALQHQASSCLIRSL